MHGKKPGIKQSITFMGRLIHMLNRNLHRIAGQIRHGLPELHDCYFIKTTVKLAQSVPK